MRLKEEPGPASVSKALASFSKVTVWTLHRAIIKWEMSFTLARLTFPFKWVLRTEVNSLFLVAALVFFIRKMFEIILLIY
tara:strand:+ start:893 stop:1132 length:240 start_codon:yes stop_codon:yes gene_type:complete